MNQYGGQHSKARPAGRQHSAPRARAAAPATGGMPRFLRYKLQPAELAQNGSQDAEAEARGYAGSPSAGVARRGSTSDQQSLAHTSLRAASAQLPAGHSVPALQRRQHAARLGDSLDDVRLHTDTAAAQVAAAAGANAYTLGRDIYFGPGQYQPGAPDGERLLAHELAHAAQHGAGDHQQVHADLGMSVPVPLGSFEIDMADRTAPLKPGLEGHIRFQPDTAGPYSADIGLIQAVQMTDVAGTSTTAGDPWNFTNPGDSNRNLLGTTGSQGEERGWHVDTTYQDPAKTEGSQVSPSYPVSVGLAAGHNEEGWLRSPTDWHAASLYDYPGFAGGDIDYRFETVAKGMDNQTVYGGLEWGFGLRAGLPVAEYARPLVGTSTEFDLSLQRFRAFFTHEPTVIYFDIGNPLPAAGEEAKLDEAAQWLAEFPDAHVEIEGHADETGPSGLNLRLSQDRALSVAGELLVRGLAPERIARNDGGGATHAFAPGVEAGQLRANRRAEIRFVRNASTPLPP